MAENKGKWSITIAGCSSSWISGWCFWEKKESGDGSWSASCLLCWGLASWPTPASRGQSFRPACWGWPGIGRFTDSLHGTNPEDVISNMTAWSPDLQLLPHLSSPLSLPETLLIFPDQTVITSPGSGTFSTPMWHWTWTSSCERATLPEKYPHQLQLILGPLSDLCLCSRTNSMKALHRQMKEKFIETWQSCFTLSTELSPPTWTSLWSVVPNICFYCYVRLKVCQCILIFLILILCTEQAENIDQEVNDGQIVAHLRPQWQSAGPAGHSWWRASFPSYLWTSSPHPPAAEQHHGPYSLRVGSLISWEISLSLSVQICPSSDEWRRWGRQQRVRDSSAGRQPSRFWTLFFTRFVSSHSLLDFCKLLSPGWFTVRRPTTSCLVRRIISDITTPLRRKPGWSSPLEFSLRTKQIQESCYFRPRMFIFGFLNTFPWLNI